MDNIHRYIEHTNLKPTITDRDVDALVKEGIENQFVGICLPPFWVKRASRELSGSNVQLVTVAGFPLGYHMTETKLTEMDRAIADGANEIDMVMDISAFKTGMPWTKIEIAKSSKLAHEAGVILKVIIETAYLSKQEIIDAANLAKDAGADFIKTSTGFAPSGANVDDIVMLRKELPSNVGIKASGGIKTYQQAQELITAGADRLGTSSGLEIVKQGRQNEAS